MNNLLISLYVSKESILRQLAYAKTDKAKAKILRWLEIVEKKIRDEYKKTG